MPQGDKGRVDLDLKLSLCTDNPTGTDIYPPGSHDAQHVRHTGIERQGGITSIYEQETTFSAAGTSTMIAKNGTVIQVDASNNVLLDNTSIGNIGPLAIKNRGMLPSCLDAAWTADGTIVFVNRINNNIIYSEYNVDTKTIINTRTIAFGSISTLAIYSICLVKYVDMHYVTAIQLMAWDGVTLRWLQETGLAISNVNGPSPGVSPKSLYAWTFDGIGGTKFLWGFQGSVGNHWIGNPVGAAGVNLAFAKWTVFHRWIGGSLSSAFLSFDVFKNAANTWTGFAEVGYIQGGGYSATPTYYGVALAAIVATNGITPVNGPGYSETTYTRSDTGTNIYAYYAPNTLLGSTPATYYVAHQTQTHTPSNAYGKLDDYSNSNPNLVLWRICMINGQPSYLAAAPIGTVNGDYLGVPMTNVGEFDESFCVHLTDNGATFSRIVYRYNGKYFWINVTPTATHTLQKVSDNLYTVNCLSPANAIDIHARLLKMGTNDYNGRMYFSSTAAITTTHKLAAKLEGQFVNSVDTGDKLITQTITASTILEWGQGTRLPNFIDRQIEDYSFDYYYDDLYLMTLYSDAPSPQINFDQIGTLYVPDTRLPFAMGYSFLPGVMQADLLTIFTGVGAVGRPDIDYDYAGYELGNDIAGLYQSFYLFGQRYLFDGLQIWLSTFGGSLYQNKEQVCPATGMQLIAASPNAVYFYSAFDQSLSVFSGGRALTKMHRFNDIRNSADVIEGITDGVFSVVDNTLLMQTASTFLWIRDGVVTQNDKKATQTGLSLFDTTAGIQIANNTKKWHYSFEDIGGTSVVAFAFQSAYYGVGNNIMMMNTAFDVTLYSPSKATTSVTLICSYLDADGASSQTPRHLKIKASDWNALGIYRCRIRPQIEKVIAASIGVQYATKLVIPQIAMEWTEDVPAVPANSRSV